jgi:hypothetical protein
MPGAGNEGTHAPGSGERAHPRIRRQPTQMEIDMFTVKQAGSVRVKKTELKLQSMTGSSTEDRMFESVQKLLVF